MSSWQFTYLARVTSHAGDKLFGLDVEVAEAVVTAEDDLAAGLKRMEALHLEG